ncbi:MAG: copper chaperone PCu(A)C [Xanthobacteraceae bacterium]|nr:copper chaperone PCu(A)C [Xanthobacteraceae bacterium]
MILIARKYVGRALAAVSALAVALLLPLGVQAADYNVGPMHIDSPWTRATPKGASSGAGYLTVTNNGTAPDRLSCASSAAAGACQIHSMTMEGGVMKMRPVEGGLEIKPGETVTLKPGGYHVMFVDLKHPLEQGSAFEATLQFEKAGTVKVEFPVLALGAAAPGANTGGSMMMDHGGMMQQMDKH